VLGSGPRKRLARVYPDETVHVVHRALGVADGTLGVLDLDFRRFDGIELVADGQHVIGAHAGGDQ
jgi:hypothetical protein